MAPWWLRTSNDEQVENTTPTPVVEDGSPTPKVEDDGSTSAAEESPADQEAPASGDREIPASGDQEVPDRAAPPPRSSPRPWWQGGPAPEAKIAVEGEAAPQSKAAPESKTAPTPETDPSEKDSAEIDASEVKPDPETAPAVEAESASEAESGSTDPTRRRRRRRRRAKREEPTPDTVSSTAVEAENTDPSSTDAPEPTAEVEPPKAPEIREPRPRDCDRPRGGARRERRRNARSTEPRRRQPAAEPVAATEGTAELPLERGLVYSLPERPATSDERKIAVFCDFENIAIGVRESEIKKLDINLILVRLLQKGKIIVKKAYADWERYSEYKRPFHEAAIELIDIPQKYYSGKNSADIKMVVDAMDLCYSKEHLDTFVIVSGDSDFSPLVSKLKENNKYVIGMGVKNSSSSLLIDNCDEFIYYEDVWRMAQQRPRLDNLPPKQAEAFALMSDAMLALMRENKDVLWGSMIKQTMQRMRPSFNESYYGYNTFSELLEDAAKKRVVGVKKDQRSGNYVVTGFIVRR